MPFDPEFDKALNERVIQEIDEREGCFGCHAPNPRMACSRCQAVKYCGKDCQRMDWKRDHKELCKLICSTRDKDGGYLLIALFCCGLIDQQTYSRALEERRDLLLDLCTKSPPMLLTVEAAVIKLFEKIHLVTGLEYVGSGQKIFVNHVYIDEIGNDHSHDAMERLYTRSGSLSPENMELVQNKLQDFLIMLKRKGITVYRIVFGRGILGLCGSGDDDRFKRRLRAAGCEPEIMMPSMQHAFGDVQADFIDYLERQRNA